MSARYLRFVLAVSFLASSFLSGVSVCQAQSATKVSEPAISNPAVPSSQTPTPDAESSPADAGSQLPSGTSGPSVAPTPVIPAPIPAISTPVSTARTTSSRNNNSSFSPRLARAAPIMGDTLSPSLVVVDEFGEPLQEVPLGGGATRSKIAENSSSLPMDRLIFNYNHFENAIDDAPGQATNIDRFTVGFERTFLDQLASIEVRFPFVLDNDFSVPGDFTRNGSDAGNLSVTLKGVLASDNDRLFAAGLTIDTPTAGNTVLLDEGLANPLTIDISNEAVHLAPFLGFLCAPNNTHTHQGFIQLDVATNPNTLTFSDISGTNTAELLEQTLLYIDYQFTTEFYHAGRRSRSGRDIHRVLGLAELHYTTTLEDAEQVASGTAANPLFELTSAGNRLDVVNLTLGLHTEFSCGTQLRLGAVAPISDDDNRFFDFEFQAQLNFLLR